MNAHPDPWEAAMALVQCLSRGDQCRFVDAVLAGLGEMAPIPQLEDDRQDALWWRENQPHTRKAIMWTIISDGLSEAQLASAIKYLEGLRK